MSMIGVVGTMVDRGFVPEMRKAVPIDQLLEWTYRRQRADMVVGMGAGLQRDEAAVDGVFMQGVSTCGCASVARIASLGCRVDSNGGPPGHLHEDAERIHGRVIRLPKPLAMLVIRHARVGSTPDGHAAKAVKARPSMNGKGKVSVRYDRWDRRRNYGWCPVEWTISLARLEAARLEYGMWWDAIAMLARELGGSCLVAHKPLPPVAPRQPWVKLTH
jgi:hypothetical protein